MLRRPFFPTCERTPRAVRQIEIGGTFVYAIQSGDFGPVKFGIALDPFQRLAALQVASFEELRLILFEDFSNAEWARETETELHALLAPFRIRGEWFRFEGYVIEVLSLYALGTSLADIIGPQELAS